MQGPSVGPPTAEEFARMVAEEQGLDGATAAASSGWPKLKIFMGVLGGLTLAGFLWNSLTAKRRMEWQKEQEREEARFLGQLYKEEGNRMFVSGKLSEAIKDYSKALQLDVNNELTLLNRAVAFYENRQWSECLKDCLTILHFVEHLPRHYSISARAYALAGKVFEKMGNLESAVVMYQASLSLKTIKSTHEDLNKLTDALSSLRQSKTPESEEEKGPTDNTENDYYQTFPPSHFGVRIQKNATNHALFALRDVNQGETIFKEKPFVCLLESSAKLHHCSHCMKRLVHQQKNASESQKQQQKEATQQDDTKSKGKEKVVDDEPEQPEDNKKDELVATKKQLSMGPTTCRYCQKENYCDIFCQMEAWSQYHKSLCTRDHSLPESVLRRTNATSLSSSKQTPQQPQNEKVEQEQNKSKEELRTALQRFEEHCQQSERRAPLLVARLLARTLQAGTFAEEIWSHLDHLEAGSDVAVADSPSHCDTEAELLKTALPLRRNSDSDDYITFQRYTSLLHKVASNMIGIHIADEVNSSGFVSPHSKKATGMGLFLVGNYLLADQTQGESNQPNVSIRFPAGSHEAHFLADHDIQKGDMLVHSFKPSLA